MKKTETEKVAERVVKDAIKTQRRRYGDYAWGALINANMRQAIVRAEILTQISAACDTPHASMERIGAIALEAIRYDGELA